MMNYNLNSLKEQCGDDTGFFNEMLDVFARSAREGIRNMESALEGEDLQMVQHFAHKIISPFRHIEANEIVIKLKNVESFAESSENKQKCAVLIEEVKNETEQLIAGLKGEYL